MKWGDTMIDKISDYTTTTLFSTSAPKIEPEYHETFEVTYENTVYYNNSQDPINCPKNLEDIFQQASEQYNISIDLLKAVAKAESDFDTNCTSSAGAMGIMQLMPETAKGLGVTNAYDPEQNIMAGAKYLAENLKIFNGDTSLALAAYNAGRGAVAKYDGIPPYKETQNYVKKILSYLEEGVKVPNIAINGTNNTYTTQTASYVENYVPALTKKEKMAMEELTAKSNAIVLSQLYSE